MKGDINFIGRDALLRQMNEGIHKVGWALLT
jgi:hypothetical protein